MKRRLLNRLGEGVEAMGTIKDITGQQFGRLTVIEMVGLEPGRGAFYRCKCTCGQEAIVNGCSLRSGNTRSCGCIRLETLEQNRRKWFRLLTHDGRTQSIDEWSKELGLSKRTIRKRIDDLGWSVDRALSAPRQVRRGT